MNSIEIELANSDYPSLFQQGRHNKANSIWNGGKNQKLLEDIIQAQSVPLKIKFLAAEMLRHFDVEIKNQHYKYLAKAYVHALEYTSENKRNAMHLSGNLWGFLYPLNDCGYLGEQLIKFGAAAIPFLLILLDDKGHVFYEGSREATMGSELNYRVCDFAAFYISKIKNISIQFHHDFESRNRAIEHLKNTLLHL